MVDDLGMSPREVHAATQRVLGFWFDEVAPERRFAKDDALDADIRQRFGHVRDAVFASGGEGWRDDPMTSLAAIILLDQFSRNLFRGSGEAFAADDLARDIAEQAIEQGWEDRYTTDQRAFLYLPFMHAEDALGQARSLERYAALGLAENLDFAIQHARVITRYGRFPTRNAALGRSSTDAEAEYLSQPDAGW